MLEFGGFSGAESIEEATDYAQLIEDLGFHTLWGIDSQQIYTELYVTLTACAQVTDSLELAPGITNPVTRHPTVTASAISSVNDISGGRANLGIGAGDSAVWSIGQTPTTVSELQETAKQVQSLLGGETVTFEGEPFTLESAPHSIDVYVAAEGPKTLRMAGETGDGVIFGGGPKPETVRSLGLENIRQGADAAGRTLDDLKLIVLTPVSVAESQTAAVKEIRPMIEPIVYHNFSYSVEDAPPKFQDDLQQIVDAHDMQEHGKEDASVVTEYDIADETWRYLADRFAVTGPPETCRERLRNLADLGVDHVICTFQSTQEALGETREFAKEVIEPLQNEMEPAD
jgi:5,10-methylenetetrahydromethanopterin reductase